MINIVNKMKKIKLIGAILIIVALLLSFFTQSLTVFAVEPNAIIEDVGPVMVSMGDSYSAGEGIPKFYGQEERNIEIKLENPDWLAHRSTKSWPGLLTLPGVDGTMAKNRNVNWYFVAASGAVTADLNGRQKKDYYKEKKQQIGRKKVTKIYDDYEYLDKQLLVFENLPKNSVDYVTITIGGNDAGFSKIVKEAAMGSTFLNYSGLPDMLNETWEKFYEDNGIRADIKDAYLDIKEAAGEKTNIIVAGYPKLISANGLVAIFDKTEARMINDSVSAFNLAIHEIVYDCKTTENMNICFVSVEEEFAGKEAYCKGSYLNGIEFTHSEDLDDEETISAYSMHPNEEGAKAYARCVQRKINDIEAGIPQETESPVKDKSAERDIVLVVDTSGSMSGEPIDETKNAANKFIDTILKQDANIGFVTYDDTASMISDFSVNFLALKAITGNIRAGGGTNLGDGLGIAEKMLDGSTAKNKIIVVMSDGLPNQGLVGDELTNYADQLKQKGIYIYTLGFFQSMGDSAGEAETLMRNIASDGCYYNVDNAANLKFFFGDIADQINGQGYIYVRIACPVDVTVEYNGEVLCSEEETTNTRTSFGSLTFEENIDEEDSDYYDDDVESDNRIKILRLKDGVDYNIKIEGNGYGRMNYTIGFTDSEGQYSDMREFRSIKIKDETVIDTIATKADTTTLSVDENGDGEYDYIYEAGANGTGQLVEPTDWTTIIIVGIVCITIVVIFVYFKKKKSNVTAQ